MQVALPKNEDLVVEDPLAKLLASVRRQVLLDSELEGVPVGLEPRLSAVAGTRLDRQDAFVRLWRKGHARGFGSYQAPYAARQQRLKASRGL